MGVGQAGEKGVVSVTLRPKVPMGHVVGTPFVVALGAAEALGARVAWPHGVASADGAPLLEVRTRAGYDDDGLFVACDLAGEGASPQLADAVCARVDAWASDVAAGRAAAGPLAPVLSDYFDACALMGAPVEVLYPNGRVAARGTLAGVDVWGRATVRLEDGRELELAPEQASLRPAE